MIVRFRDAYPCLVFIAKANMMRCLGSELRLETQFTARDGVSQAPSVPQRWRLLARCESDLQPVTILTVKSLDRLKVL